MTRRAFVRAKPGGAQAAQFIRAMARTSKREHSRVWPRMPRTYALMQLLAHGPLDASQLRQITGWPPKLLANALQQQLRSGALRVVNVQRQRQYALSEKRPTPGARTQTRTD